MRNIAGESAAAMGGHIIMYTLARHVSGVSTHVRNEKNGNLEIALHTGTQHVEYDTYHKY